MKVENSIIILTIKWSRMKSSFVILIDDREFNKEFVNSITKNWIKHLTLMLQATYKISPIPEIFSFFLLQISSAVFLGAIMLHQLDHSIFYGLHNLRTISCKWRLKRIPTLIKLENIFHCWPVYSLKCSMVIHGLVSKIYRAWTITNGGLYKCSF